MKNQKSGVISERAIRDVHARLIRRFGPRPWRADREPILDSLVATILSQNTSDVNSSRAFAQLKATFPEWDEVRRAPAKKVEDAIRSGGLAKTKALRIKIILEKVHAQRGETSLEYLRRLPTARIKEELRALPGVGPKTAACVLMFTLKRADFPVDTHIHRISKRLGWTSPRHSAEQTYELLNTHVPEILTYALHVLLITLGRKVCKAQTPLCLECPLWLACAHAKELRKKK